MSIRSDQGYGDGCAAGLLICAGLCGIVLVFGYEWGTWNAVQKQQKAAVEAGHARYNTITRDFEWLPACTPKEASK